MIGRGLCRGPDWQNGQWPHDEGFETLEQCSLECEKRPGCTGFDMTPTPDLKDKFRCILHGHDDIQVASASSLQISKCYRMIGKKAIKGGAKPTPAKAAKAPKVCLLTLKSLLYVLSVLSVLFGIFSTCLY